MQEELIVELGSRSYPICFFHGARDAFCERVKTDLYKHSQIFLFIDREIPGDVLDGLTVLTADDNIHVFPQHGEPLKSLNDLGVLLDWLAERKGDRHVAVVAVGGGVVGDLVGFAAATYLRGVEYYQIPTTLLAMVDSSVGGKTGINIKAGKNLVGAFCQPKSVYIDTGFLKSLPEREFAAGMAEVIKYGMLADADLFLRLVEGAKLTPAGDDLPAIIRRCCEIKAGIVSSDETEQAASGGRALLNLGHTFGHAIEQVAGYGEYLHGEAIAIGLVLAAKLSKLIGELDDDLDPLVCEVAEKYGLPCRLRTPLAVDKLMDAMRRDKKTRSGKLRLVVMRALGDAITTENVDEGLIRKLWDGCGAKA